MSIENAKAFVERIKSDEDFSKEVWGKATPEERTKYVKAAGYDFTKEELDTVRSELSVEELEEVSGGHWGCGSTHEAENSCGQKYCYIS